MAAVIEAYDWQLKVFEAMEDPSVEQIACVGSRGPGKTWAAQRVNIIRSLQMPNTNHIILRSTSDDIVKQYAPAMGQLLNDFPGVGRIDNSYNSNHKVFIVRGKGGESRIFLGFAKIKKDAEKYQGIEYATATYDEITHFEEFIPQLINASVRGTRNLKTLYFGNPGSIGHQWVKRRFVKRDTRDPNTLVLQPSLRDNIVLAREDPTYADRLTAGLPEWKKKQWLRGDWDANEGQYFDVPPGCIRHVKIPYYANVYAGVDWGHTKNKFACVWMAVWRDMYTGRHRCHIFCDLGLFKKRDAEQAREALDMEESRYFEDVPFVKARFADPSTGKETETDNDEQTRSTAQAWARNGFVTIPAKRRGRVAGWSLLREFLTPLEGYVNSDDPEDQHGVMTISPNCAGFIEELTGAQHKEVMGHLTDDVADPDDYLDCARYLLVMIYNMTFPQSRTLPYVKKTDMISGPRRVLAIGAK